MNERLPACSVELTAIHQALLGCGQESRTILPIASRIWAVALRVRRQEATLDAIAEDAGEQAALAEAGRS